MILAIVALALSTPLDVPAILALPAPAAGFAARWGQPSKECVTGEWSGTADKLPSFSEAKGFQGDRSGDRWTRIFTYQWNGTAAEADGVERAAATCEEDEMYFLLIWPTYSLKGVAQSMQQTERRFGLIAAAGKEDDGHWDFEIDKWTWAYSRVGGGVIHGPLPFSFIRRSPETEADDLLTNCQVNIDKGRITSISYRGLPFSKDPAASLKLVGLTGLSFRRKSLSDESSLLVGALPGWDVTWDRVVDDESLDLSKSGTGGGFCRLLFEVAKAKPTKEQS